MKTIARTQVVFDTPVGRAVNEDTFVADQAGQIYGVFDGASGLTPDVPGLPTKGAKMASELVADVLAQQMRSEAISFKEALLRANAFLKMEMMGHDVLLEKTRRWGTTVAAIRLTEEGLDWVTVGDSVIIVLNRDGTFFLPGGLDYDHDGEALLSHVELRGQGMTDKAEIDAILLPIHLRVRNRANIDYGVVNGEPEVGQFIRTGVLPYENIAHVIMVTDGLFLPATDPLAPDDWATWVRMYQLGGLSHVCKYVRQTQTDDPDCILYPRLKPQDDIAAVAIEFA